jgi:hypothetical protein
MLEEMSKKVGTNSIVSWQPHGKAFRVHQVDVFARTVMPRYFKQTQYRSFQRQLHIYGFLRISKGLDRGAYAHPIFIRDKKSLSLRMSCIKIKGKRKSTKKYTASNTPVLRRAHADVPEFQSSANVCSNVLIMKQHAAMLQADPILQQSYTSTKKEKECGKGGPAKPTTPTAFTNGSRDHHTDEEEPLVNNALFFSQEEVPCDALVDWMEQAQTILSRNEKQGSPYPHGYDDSSLSEKGHEASTVLYGANHQKHFDEGHFEGKASTVLYGASHQKHFDEGHFEGKRFFYVGETTIVLEDFRSVPRFYMPSSA